MNGQRVERPERPHEGRSESRPRYLSPLRLFAIIAFTVFTGEFVVMLVLALLPEMPTVTEALLDGFMITLLVTPALVLFLIRPMVVHISHREILEEKLRNVNDILEDRVTERTAELMAANEHLKREIVERKTAERGLSRSADFIEMVLGAAPCILAIYDVNTMKCSFVNDAITSLLGYSPDDVIVKGEKFFREVFSPEDFDSFSDLNSRMAAGIETEILKCECQLRTSDNQLHRFGIGLVVLLTTAENQPKDALLAAVPISASPPHFESGPEPGVL